MTGEIKEENAFASSPYVSTQGEGSAKESFIEQLNLDQIFHNRLFNMFYFTSPDKNTQK